MYGDYKLYNLQITYFDLYFQLLKIWVNASEIVVFVGHGQNEVWSRGAVFMQTFDVMFFLYLDILDN